MVEARTNPGADAINIGATNCYDGNYLEYNDDELLESSDGELAITSDTVQATIDGLGNEDDMNAFSHLAFTADRRLVSMHNIYQRYGGSHMRMPNKPSMQLLSMAHTPPTQS